jgi:hypothetical protein
MITMKDCIAFCGLTEEEVLALAEHEHIPEMVATGLANQLMKQRHGADKVRTMMVEDIRTALKRGDRRHAQELFAALRHFLAAHPDYCRVAGRHSES